MQLRKKPEKNLVSAEVASIAVTVFFFFLHLFLHSVK